MQRTESYLFDVFHFDVIVACVAIGERRRIWLAVSR